MSVLAYLFLIIFLLGMGALVASSLPTRGARIGLGAVLVLALVVDVTWVLAPLMEWSPALGDAAWLIVFLMVLAGAWTASVHHGSATGLPAFSWPGRHDLVFLGVIIAAFGVVVFVLPVPLDTDAQGFGYLALVLREGGDHTTLAPWHPETDFLYSPGYFGLIAHLSARFDLGIHALQLVFSAVTAVLFVWLAYDLGHELEGPRTGRAFMLAALGGTGLITAFMDSHYTALLALSFSLAFLTFVLRFLGSRRWLDALLAAVCLAGVPISQPDTTLALMIGYVPWLFVIWLARPRPTLRAWIGIAVVIPLIALGITAPWLLSIRDLLDSGIESPFVVETSHWRTMILTHGGVIALLALIGVLHGLRRRSPAQLLMIVWLVGIVEFSTLGLLESAIPSVMEPLLKYDYPFSLAWHGPIIPYTVLGGLALVWLADRLDGARGDRWVGRLAIPVLVLVVAALAAGVVFFDPLLETSKDYASFYGAFSSSADVEAMTWLRDHTPEDARILNHPGPHEGDWVPVIAERDAVYFRSQPFFHNTDTAKAEQDAFRAFWRNPADPEQDYAALFAQYGVSYVVVPQVFGDPDSFEDMIRWRRPLEEAESYLQTPISEDIPYLRLVHAEDGAQIYEVVAP
jgi:hypothetical protein